MEFGCSSFSWETADGLHLLGRTYDFVGNIHKNRVISAPRGYLLPLEPNCGQNRNITGKYAFLGMAVMDLEIPVMVDGLNEKGLMGGLLNYYGYASYPSLPNRLTIYPGALLTFMLARCASVQEVADAAGQICLKDYCLQGKALQVHYLFSDRSGETIVLEPGPNGLAVYRQTIGVLTNVPDFPWQMTNLCNYVAVTNRPAGPKTVVNCEINGFSATAGCSFGLPGGYSSPERFVRLTFTKNFAFKGTGEVDGITRIFQCLAPVIIPRGVLKTDGEQNACVETLSISAMCAESLTYYFSPTDNRRITAISLPPLLEQRTIQYFPVSNKQDILRLN